MAIARVQVTMERDSLIPADRIVNTLHYAQYLGGVQVADFLTPTEAQALATNFLAEWTPWMASLLGSSLTGAVNVKVYDAGDPEPRVPLGEAEDLSNTVSATCLPNELAVCLSFSGEEVSGTAQARRRGRIFLGPLPTTAMDSATVGDVGVAATYRSNAISLGQAIATVDGTSGTTFALGVLSRRRMADGETLHDAFTRATRLWVDNAFDVQRKRGKVASVRSAALVVA